MEDQVALPDPDGQEIEPQEPTAPAAPSAEPPIAEPAAEVEELVVEGERYQIPKSVVTEYARSTGRTEAEAKRALQTGLDHGRIYNEQRAYEQGLARRAADLDAREKAISDRAKPAPAGKRPDVREDAVGFWDWTAERLEKLDRLDGMMEDLKTTLEAQREAQSDSEIERQFFQNHQLMMDNAKQAGLPYVDPVTLANTISHYGIGDRDDLSMAEKMEAGYRIAAWGIPGAAALPANPTPPPRPRAVPPRVQVPRAAAGMPPQNGDSGETLEQRRNRLLNTDVANTPVNMLAHLERGDR